jgi:hypothetical protein
MNSAKRRRQSALSRAAAVVAVALMIVPLIAMAGAATDFVRLWQFKAALQNVASDAALAGAIVYVNADSRDRAAKTSESYLAANGARLSGQDGPLSYSVSAAPTKSADQAGFGVTVQATGNVAPAPLGLSLESRAVSVTAAALNPANPVVASVPDAASAPNAAAAPNVDLVVGQTRQAAHPMLVNQ